MSVKATVQNLDSGQLDMMWSFLQLGNIKPDVKDAERLIEYTDKIRQALIQKTGGQRNNDPSEYVNSRDIGTYINMIVIECLSLRISGALERLMELMKNGAESMQS